METHELLLKKHFAIRKTCCVCLSVLTPNTGTFRNATAIPNPKTRHPLGFSWVELQASKSRYSFLEKRFEVSMRIRLRYKSTRETVARTTKCELTNRGRKCISPVTAWTIAASNEVSRVFYERMTAEKSGLSS